MKRLIEQENEFEPGDHVVYSETGPLWTIQGKHGVVIGWYNEKGGELAVRFEGHSYNHGVYPVNLKRV